MFADKQTVWLLWPEIALTAMAVWILVGNALFRPRPSAQTRLGWTTFAALAVCFAAFALYWHQGGFDWGTPHLGSGPLAVDYFAYAMRSVALLAGLQFVLQSSR
ncbi:MAG: hypothetical protein KY475_15490, partial [Planctomycetes bacterium]|nr:hypothetical protein [Planctomycetota bacterium]